MQILMGLIQSLAVFGFFIQISTVQAKPVVDKKYPRILEVEGVVFDLARSGSRPLSKNDRILESFHPTTQSDSKMIVAINPQLTLELDENSELVLPAISWETRQVSEIRIVKGRVHIEASERQKILKVKSELFESEIPPGHFIFEINQAEAKAQLMVLEGELSFGALNADETVKLKSGEKVAFQAIKENNEFQYDLLLKGRKVPKGQLGSVEALSAQFIKANSRQEKLKDKNLKIKKAVSAAANLSRDEICHAPKGRLNHCVWRMEDKKCIRRRCTADGLWKDPQEVGLSHCQKKAQVQLCNY